jgi:alternate signal-mediated exported protein
MNKLVKGSIAGAVGVALMLGGAGTFATWNSSIGVSNSTITAGNLLVSDPTPTDGVWTVQKNGAGSAQAVSSIATFLASPGDKLTYTKKVKITATGDNLTANLSLGSGSIAAAPAPADAAASAALATLLTKTAEITATGTGITSTGTNTFSVTPGSAGITAQDVTVSVVITFPKSATAGAENAAKTGAVTLSGLTVNLLQS